jgi:hypothetical protein
MYDITYETLSEAQIRALKKSAKEGTGCKLTFREPSGSGTKSDGRVALYVTKAQRQKLKNNRGKPVKMTLTAKAVREMQGAGFISDAISWLGRNVAKPIISGIANTYAPGSGEKVGDFVDALSDKVGDAAELGVDTLKKNSSAKKTSKLIKGHLHIYKLRVNSLDKSDPAYQEKKEEYAREFLQHVAGITKTHGEKHINKSNGGSNKSNGGSISKKKR